MRVYLALRLFHANHVRFGIESRFGSQGPRGQVIDQNIERLHPALKNIIEYLRASGKIPVVRAGTLIRREGEKEVEEVCENCRVHWCEVETDLNEDYWRGLAEVEAVILKEEFATFTQSIRHRGGSNYIEACERYADQLPVCASRAIRYEAPKVRSTRAA